MNDVASDLIEREAGPSWARPNWPLAELDELNLGLDPTQATIEKVKAAVAEKAAADRRSDPHDDPPRRRGQHPRDDADPHLSRARASRRRPRSARPRPARGAGRPDARISRLHRRRPRPADLARRRARLRAGDRARDRRACCRRNYCGHVGLEYMHINDVEERRFLQERMEGKDAEIQLHARGQAVDPDQGHPRRAVGEIPRHANMSAPSASGSTAAKARSRRSRR